MPPLDQFVDKLIEEKDFIGVDEEVIAEMKADLGARLEDRINALIVASLPPQHLEEFEKLLDEGTPEQSQEFVKKHIPDLEELLAAELLAFRATYLG